MNISLLLFGIWTALLAAFGFAMIRQELTCSGQTKRPTAPPLSPRSINWITLIGLAGAVAICCLD